MRNKSLAICVVLLLASPILADTYEWAKEDQSAAGQVEANVETMASAGVEEQVVNNSKQDRKESITVPKKGAEPLEKRRKWWRFWEFWD